MTPDESHRGQSWNLWFTAWASSGATAAETHEPRPLRARGVGEPGGERGEDLPPVVVPAGGVARGAAEEVGPAGRPPEPLERRARVVEGGTGVAHEVEVEAVQGVGPDELAHDALEVVAHARDRRRQVVALDVALRRGRPPGSGAAAGSRTPRGPRWPPTSAPSPSRGASRGRARAGGAGRSARPAGRSPTRGPGSAARRARARSRARGSKSRGCRSRSGLREARAER